MVMVVVEGVGRARLEECVGPRKGPIDTVYLEGEANLWATGNIDQGEGLVVSIPSPEAPSIVPLCGIHTTDIGVRTWSQQRVALALGASAGGMPRGLE
jgi:hypothetical protein